MNKKVNGSTFLNVFKWNKCVCERIDSGYIILLTLTSSTPTSSSMYKMTLLAGASDEEYPGLYNIGFKNIGWL